MRNLGIPVKSIDYVEIDEKAVRSYNAMFKDDMFQKAQDVRGWNLRPDVLVHGSPCFPEGTLVLTDQGYKDITEIVPGNLVIDKNRNYSKVLRSEKTGDKEVLKISVTGTDGIEATPNHRFLVRSFKRVWNNDRRLWDRVFSDPQWKECAELIPTYDYLGIPVNKESKLPDWQGVECHRGKTTYIKKNLDMNDPKLWYIAGRFLGDGWPRHRNERSGRESGIIICCGKHKADAFEKEIAGFGSYTKVEERTVFKYQFSNRELAVFMSQFGKGAANKFVPGFVFDLPSDLLKEFLRGYTDSDGCERNDSTSFTTVSRMIAYGIGQCIAKVYHRPFTMNRCERPKTCVIEGRTVNQKDSYTVRFHKEAKQHDEGFYENGYIWLPVKKVEETGKVKPVFDFEVEESHSFTANGVIVHNCQDYSIAGHQGKASGEGRINRGAGGDEGSETRSSLMWETLNIIKNMGVWKPRVVIWENVKNVLSKRMRHNFEKYLKEMEKLGYVNSYRVLNAMDFGLPQKRERVFTVSILGGPAFDFDKMRTRPMKPLSEFLEGNFKECHIVKSPSMLAAIEKKKPGFNGVIHILKDDGACDCITTAQDRCPNAGVVKLSDGRFRLLTEKECWKLMGFNDADYQAAEKATKSKPGYKSGALYKQAGNSMPVPMMESIFEVLLKDELTPYLVTQPSILRGIGEKGINRATVIKDHAMTVTCRQDRCPAQVVQIADDLYRFLTERECWRLMGFTDEDFDRVKIEHPRNGRFSMPLYKQAGNSMPVPVLEEIFRLLGDKFGYRIENKEQESD